MIGRAVFRASRTSLGFVVAPSLQFHNNKHVRVANSVAILASTRFSNRCGHFYKRGLSSLEKISARQVHALASNSSSPAIADDEEVGVNRPDIVALEVEDGGDHANGVSQLSELCAGKVPEYLLRR